MSAATAVPRETHGARVTRTSEGPPEAGVSRAARRIIVRSAGHWHARDGHTSRLAIQLSQSQVTSPYCPRERPRSR
jgi:hypothetical protein